MIPGVRARGAGLRVRVDPSRCAGHGTCVEVAPDVFVLDRFGCAQLREGAAERLATDGESRARAREAAARCPATAILIDSRPEAVPVAVSPSHAPSLEWSGAPRLLLGSGTIETLDQWRAHGGFGTRATVSLIDEVAASGLRGAGGAVFDVARKWRSVGRGEPVVVANGSEGEPFTRKDQYLMTHRPFLVLDGLRSVAGAVGAIHGIIAVDERWSAAARSMRAAVAESTRSGLLSDLEVKVVEVPSAYVAGEETALLAALEGRAPLPRLRPPFPTDSGLHARPTVMHNIETLAGIALVSVHGSAWFRAEGTLSEPGTGIFGVGEFGTEPTLYERPLGYSLRQLLRDAGRLDGCTAVVVGGWSGGIIAVGDTEVALTEKDLRAAGATLGTKSVQTIPVSRCVVGVAAEIIAFLAGETAGQCVPCRDGLPWLADRLARLEAGGLPEADLEEVFAFGTSLTGRGLCAMPDGAARILGSLRTNFADVLHAHAGGCPHHA